MKSAFMSSSSRLSWTWYTWPTVSLIISNHVVCWGTDICLPVYLWTNPKRFLWLSNFLINALRITISNAFLKLINIPTSDFFFSFIRSVEVQFKCRFILSMTVFSIMGLSNTVIFVFPLSSDFLCASVAFHRSIHKKQQHVLQTKSFSWKSHQLSKTVQADFVWSIYSLVPDEQTSFQTQESEKFQLCPSAGSLAAHL